MLYVVLVCKEERQTNSVHKRNRYTSKQVKTEKKIYMYTNHCTNSFCFYRLGIDFERECLCTRKEKEKIDEENNENNRIRFKNIAFGK